MYYYYLFTSRELYKNRTVFAPFAKLQCPLLDWKWALVILNIHSKILSTPCGLFGDTMTKLMKPGGFYSRLNYRYTITDTVRGLLVQLAHRSLDLINKALFTNLVPHYLLTFLNRFLPLLPFGFLLRKKMQLKNAYTKTGASRHSSANLNSQRL